MAEHTDQPSQPLPTVPPHVLRDLALYVLARFALVAAVAVVLILINVPALLSVAAGLVVGMPLAMIVLRGWHLRVARGLAARGMARRAQRDQLRAELRGEVPVEGATPDASEPEPVEPAEHGEKSLSES